MPSESGQIMLSKKFSLLAGAAIAAMGGLVLCGWGFSVETLKSVVPGAATMKANSALSVLLCGISLMLLSTKTPSRLLQWCTRILSAAVALIGAASLAEYLTGWTAGIDQLLFPDFRSAAVLAYPGRMTPAASLGFVISGLALIIASLGSEQRWRWPMLSALGSSLAALGGMAVTAWLLDNFARVQVAIYVGMAIHTAVAFVAIGLALIVVVRSEGGTFWSIDLRSTAIILLGVICALFVAVLSNVFTYQLQRNDQWLIHTQDVLKEMVNVGGSMGELDSGPRNFVVTGDERFLAQRGRNAAMLAEHLSRLRALTADNPNQQHRLDELAVLGSRHGALMEQIVAERREKGLVAAETGAAAAEAREVSNAMRELRKAMRDEEYDLLQVRTERTKAAATRTFLLLPLCTFVGLTMLSVALFFVSAGIGGRTRAEAALRSANEHLRSNEERFRLLISGVRDYAIYLLDADGRVATWNTGAQNLKQYTAEEIVGQHFSRFYPPEAQAEQRPQRALEIARETGRYEEEGWRVRKDGTRFWADVLITTVRDDRGKSVGFAKVTRDRTEHRRIQQTLKEDEARLTAVIGSAMDGVITVDERQNITLFNPAAERMFGRSSQSVMGRPLEQLMPERFRKVHAAYISEFASSNTSRRRMGALNPTSGLRANGEEFAIEASISQAQVGGQRIFSVILRDISERNRAEEELRQQARLLDLVPVLVRDMRYHIVLWSSAVEKIYGYSAPEALGALSHELLQTIFPAPTEQIERELLEKGTWEGELIHRTRTGEKVIVNSRWVLYRDAQGTPVRILEVNDDITARKHAEAQQARSQKLESLGTLSGGIAHDFNNILLAVGGNAQLAIADLPADHPVQQSLKEIARGAARATDLVRRILAFSRPQEMKREAIQLQPVVEEALELVRATIPATIEFRATFTEGLPAVLADPTQLHQIIVNLATNASHAIGSRSDGMIQVQLDSVELTKNESNSALALAPGNYVRLLVSDNGSGMERAILDRIFDPFFTTKGPGEGTGLGLSVVHGILKNHGGGITVYSEPGRGTAFRLYFPATTAAVAVVKEVPQEELRQRSERILYVDDEEALVALVKRTLERLGYKVTGVCNPLRAVKLFREDPTQFDAVVTDLAMPQLSGFDMSQQMLGIRADIPIVMTSGYVRPEDQERALSIGLRDLILKPDTIEQLARTLDQVFQQQPTDRLVPSAKPLKG
jgi:PAS domain S-box-containing protein